MKSFTVLVALLFASTEAFTVQRHAPAMGMKALRMSDETEAETPTPVAPEEPKAEGTSLEAVESLGRGAAKVSIYRSLV